MQMQISGSIASFYHELYNLEDSFNKHDCNFLSSNELSCLSSDDSAKLECEVAAKDMHKGRSPGPDGIPPEFYLTFWPLIGPLLLDMIQYSIIEGSFSRDVNSALITILLEKGNDSPVFQLQASFTIKCRLKDLC